MKKTWVWVMVILLTAAISVAGTFAYLTSTDEDTNVMTIGNVIIDQLEYERVDTQTKGDDAIVQEFHNDKPLYPAVTEDGFDWATDASVDWNQIGKDSTSGIWDPEKLNNEQDKMVFVKNKGDYEAHVRTVFAVEAGHLDWDAFREKIHLNLNDTDWTWEWIETPVTIGDGTYFLATATYNRPLKPGELTRPSLLQVALDSTAENEDVLSFGENYVILTASQAIQADGFPDAVVALEDGFGEIAADHHPFMEFEQVTYIYNEEDLKRAAENGGLGIVMQDFEITSHTIYYKPSNVLDMNGHTITNSNPASFGYVIRVDHGANLTVKGNGKFADNHPNNNSSACIFITTGEGSVLTLEDGYYDVGKDDSSDKLVQAQLNGKIIINGGTIVNIGGQKTTEMIYGISGGTIEINGGFFRNDGSYRYTINLHDGRPGKVIVKGGTFVNHCPGKSNDPGRVTVAEGYTVVSEEKENGEIWYTVVPV